MPGYRSQRQDPQGGPAGRGAGSATPGSGWSGPARGDAAGRGPIRGFPPAPGQPPPLYPPGQFAAWNRPDAGVAVADPDSAWPATPGSDWGQDRPWPSDEALAVSEPSADATTTGTWRAYAETPDGAWGPAAGPAAATNGLDPAAAGGGWPSGAGTGPGTGPGRVADGATTVMPPGGSGTAPTLAGAGRAPGSAGPGSRTGRSSPPRGPAAKGVTAKGGPARGKRKGRSSVVLAVSAVVVLAVAAAAFLLYTASHNSPSVALPTTTPKATHPTASASPTPTPTDHILSRTADPLPLSISQLFPVNFTSGGRVFARTITKTQKNCPAAIVGTRLQTAVKAAKCSQVIRASYVAATIKVMGTIGVLNLSTSQKAAKAGHAVGRSDFIALLKGHKGVTRGLGRGTGIVEADVKGHYLILMWAQFTTHHTPRKATQKTRLENFMKALFEQTANVSLTRRMVDGTP